MNVPLFFTPDRLAMSLARLPMEEMKVMFGAFLAEHRKLSREFGSRSPLTNRLPTPGDCSEFSRGAYGAADRPEDPDRPQKADRSRKVYHHGSSDRSKLPVFQLKVRG
jgi:hypothetical protein